MLDFVESRKLKPVIDKVYPLDRVTEAFDRMKLGQHFGKIIIQIK
jgi:zinc-binding alcohol dehydrogenase/oxidoreductase